MNEEQEFAARVTGKFIPQPIEHPSGWFPLFRRHKEVQRYGDSFWEGEASGAAVLQTTYGASGTESVLPTFASASAKAYSGNAIVFGAILARLMLFSETEFKYRSLFDKKLIGNTSLVKLEQPWPNGTTGELLARMIQDADLAGNAYIWDAGEQLVRLRPDKVTIVSQEIEDDTGRTYRKVIGYSYDEFGVPGMPSDDTMFFDVEEIAHWTPIPDPCANFRGMSWLTPVVREISADSAMTEYKIRYLTNAATPNMVIKYDQKLEPDTVEKVRKRIQARYGGMENAYRTMVLDQGADYSVVGNTFEQMNFNSVQAAGENRILIASGVPGIVVGAKEGLSAATYSNYEQAMRRFSDLTMRPLWRSVCAALAKFVEVPKGNRLWFDVSDIAALRQGEKERAETSFIKAQAVGELVKAGYEPNSVIAAIDANDLSLLKPNNLVPKQLIVDPNVSGVEPSVADPFIPTGLQPAAGTIPDNVAKPGAAPAKQSPNGKVSPNGQSGSGPL